MCFDQSRRPTVSLSFALRRWTAHISVQYQIISDPQDRVAGLDAAFHKVLCGLCDQATFPVCLDLTAAMSSCIAKQVALRSYHMSSSFTDLCL